jgi:hypothetical protein
MLNAINALVAAINRVNDTLQQIGGPRGVIREQPLGPIMPPLIANQWPRRNGDNFPRGT